MKILKMTNKDFLLLKEMLDLAIWTRITRFEGQENTSLRLKYEELFKKLTGESSEAD